MAVYLGVDFGTRAIKIYQKGKGIVLREPNIAAVDANGNVVAVGSEASLLRARAPGTVTIRRPLVNGEITDFNLTAEMLDRYLEIVAPKQKKHIIVAVSYTLGAKSREILTKALGDCRTGRIILVDCALAALQSVGICAENEGEDEYSGDIVCDIGAGFVEAAYIRGGEILRMETSPFAGEAADAAIVCHAARKYGVVISAAEAREAKHKLTLTPDSSQKVTLSGLNSLTGMPMKITLPLSELLGACAPQIRATADTVAKLLTNLPQHGTIKSSAGRIILTGGGAMLGGIAGYISAQIGREVTVATEPLDCVANGLGLMLDEYK